MTTLYVYISILGLITFIWLAGSVFLNVQHRTSDSIGWNISVMGLLVVAFLIFVIYTVATR